MPPTRNAAEVPVAKVVSQHGKEFNVDEVYGSESSFIGSLKSVNQFNPVEVPPNAPVSFDEKMLKEKADAPSSVALHTSDDNLVNGDDDEPMASGEDAGVVKVKTVNSRQYVEEGMLNTKLRKAKKKKRKKQNRSSVMEDDMDDDYDFEVDYVARNSNDENKNRFQLPSGLELDN